MKMHRKLWFFSLSFVPFDLFVVKEQVMSGSCEPGEQRGVGRLFKGWFKGF